ncbi:unnamed protein product [Meloidogyne enterolobii]|uniref:Uncharacterized protein n=1 Tax=Meloidogyne enterolobii TaxID=390850 RepID=A0ACB0ZA44_MELEN
MQVTIKELCGRTHAFEVKVTDNIKTLKAMIEFKTGIPTSEHRLLYRGRQLDENETISACNIMNNTYNSSYDSTISWLLML